MTKFNRFGSGVLIFFVVSAHASANATAKETATAEGVAKWREHMRTLSANLVNAFPFLYSGSEFKKPENKKTILQSLENLAGTVHTLPVKSGEDLIGAEPLIKAASLNIKVELDDAIRLYKSGDFESSQQKVFSAIQTCFACHTAHQTGPQFPTTNAEVMGLATRNILEKAVVFGSLRQFDGSLELIDKEGLVAIDKKSPATDSLVKLYLVISLRSQQNFARASAFLKRFTPADGSSPLAKWEKDIQAWKSFTASGNRAKIAEYIAGRKRADALLKDESLFVVYLLESFSLHNQALQKTSSGELKAAAFKQLAEAYAGLNFLPFENLSETYYRACAKAQPSASIGKQCRAKIAP